MRRGRQRIGVPGLLAVAVLALSLLGWTMALPLANRVSEAQRQLAMPELPRPLVEPKARGDEARLEAFRALLLPHDDIPTAVQALLGEGENQGLRIPKGEYRLDPDAQGGFARFRMIMPVTGEAQAIQRFMAAALTKHRSLALESVQFRRENVSARQVEARIQWVLMVRLPAARDPSANGGRP